MALGRSRKPVVDPAAADPDSTVPTPLKIAGAYSWRILLVVGVIAVFVFLIIQFKYIVIPFMIAILLGALLVPLVNWLVKHKWPRGLAVALAMVGTLAVIAGLIFAVVSQIRSGFPDLQERSLQAYDDFKVFLAES